MRTQEVQNNCERTVEVPAGKHRLEGILNLPPRARGVVLFAHGSGSGRHSPRNQFVARTLNESGLATLLIDLLDTAEAEDQSKVFDIELLAKRLVDAMNWLAGEPDTRGLRVGLFGASTGAAAALVAAADHPTGIGAVVSRGGRPDLARHHLAHVKAPTLLIVGGNDEVVRELNEQALARLHCAKELVVIPGATHLFPEPGALEEVARLAQEWFSHHLTPRSHAI